MLNVNKPPGLTSATVVAKVKRLLGGRCKVGHAGTLDSFATGVLLILVGRATKRCEELMGSPKQYEATVRLGATTETLDPLSEPQPVADAIAPTAEAIREALAKQVGNVLQLPPLFSALKVGGKRASDRTRSGETIELAPRPVRIDAIELLEYQWPDCRIRIDCGRGTYVRSIARDLGQTLQTGGYLTQLCRTRVGEFWSRDAAELDSLTRETIATRLR
ncbi:MAG: tRNA pseudouridine(55) synthase TruB [Tepidisphaeraceae bacterium]